MSDLYSATDRRLDGEISLDALFRPYLRRRRLVVGALLVAWAAALAFILIPARKYRASLVLAVVPNSRSLPAGGSISALLGAAQNGGLQSTPYVVTKLLLLRSVIRKVAMSPVNGSSDLIIERVAGKPLSEIRPTDIEPMMRDMLNVEVDKQTGLITFSVEHPDSAVARQVATQVVDVASKTYVDVGRAQARSQRVAQEARVDSARRQLDDAEKKLLDFVSSNRSYTPYSPAVVTRQRLERRLENARAVYSQVIADREAAIAQELEATPAVVVVDPILRDLLPQSRHGLLKLVLATALGLAVSTVIMILLGDFAARPRELTSPEYALR